MCLLAILDGFQRTLYPYRLDFEGGGYSVLT